jgi:hypothetical protein
MRHTLTVRAEVAKKEIEADYLFARRKMAKISKAIRPMPMTQPKIHIGHIINPPIPPIIPPPAVIIPMNAINTTPVITRRAVSVVLDITHSPSVRESMNMVDLWRQALQTGAKATTPLSHSARRGASPCGRAQTALRENCAKWIGDWKNCAVSAQFFPRSSHRPLS